MIILLRADGLIKVEISPEEQEKARQDEAMYNLAFDLVQNPPKGITPIGVVAVLLAEMKANGMF